MIRLLNRFVREQSGDAGMKQADQIMQDYSHWLP